jgi:hypothetical protein
MIFCLKTKLALRAAREHAVKQFIRQESPECIEVQWEKTKNENEIYQACNESLGENKQR